jgi:hypothetical protein
VKRQKESNLGRKYGKNNNNSFSSFDGIDDSVFVLDLAPANFKRGSSAEFSNRTELSIHSADRWNGQRIKCF